MSDEWFRENTDLISVANVVVNIFPEVSKNGRILDIFEAAFDKYYKMMKKTMDYSKSVDHNFRRNYRELGETVDTLAYGETRERSSEDFIEWLGAAFGEFFGVIEFGVCGKDYDANVLKNLDYRIIHVVERIIFAIRKQNAKARLDPIRSRILTIIAKHPELLPEQINFLNRIASMF